MERRGFLMAFGGVGALGTGRICQQAYARDALRRGLVDSALPPLIAKHNREVGQIPRVTRDEVRVWFHGKCLNAASFVRETCQGPTSEVLRSLKDEAARYDYLYGRFCARVVAHAEIMNRVATVQAEAGDVIDGNWAACCSAISAGWGREVRRYAPSFAIGDLAGRLDPVIRGSLESAVRSLNQGVAGGVPVHELLGSIGRTATMMLVPMTRLPQVAVPTFLFVALTQVFGFICARAADPTGGYQAELSARLAHLGNRIGDEFETAVKNQLAEVQAFQDDAVTRQAAEIATESIPTFF